MLLEAVMPRTRKSSVPKPSSGFTTIKVSNDLAEMFRIVAAIEACSQQELADRLLRPMLQQRLKDGMAAKTKELLKPRSE